jgi:hypothetical protein
LKRIEEENGEKMTERGITKVVRKSEGTKRYTTIERVREREREE